MESTEVITEVTGKRGRGPGRIMFQSGLDVSTFDPELIRGAAQAKGKEAKVIWEEKPNKDGTKTYKNLVSLEVENGAEAVKSEELALVPTTGSVLAPTDGVERSVETLERGFALAVRQRELLEDFIRSRFQEGEHFMDGATFGSKKKVLLQPGAQLILMAHGYVVDFEILGGPLAAHPKSDELYTLTLKCILKDKRGSIVGSGIGSCSSLVWSGREARYKSRGVSPDLTHNATLKIAKKRSLVDACLNTTAGSSIFTQDLDEYPAGEKKEKKSFIRR